MADFSGPEKAQHAVQIHETVGKSSVQSNTKPHKESCLRNMQYAPWLLLRKAVCMKHKEKVVNDWAWELRLLGCAPLKMESANTSETLVNFYCTTQCNILEGSHLLSLWSVCCNCCFVPKRNGLEGDHNEKCSYWHTYGGGTQWTKHVIILNIKFFIVFPIYFTSFQGISLQNSVESLFDWSAPVH
jgi:hypothetical protein